jgi:hypothetical protein
MSTTTILGGVVQQGIDDNRGVMGLHMVAAVVWHPSGNNTGLARDMQISTLKMD